MLKDELTSSAYSSLQPIEPVYASSNSTSNHRSRSILNQQSFDSDHQSNQPHSLPFIQSTSSSSFTSASGQHNHHHQQQHRTSLYTQPSNATSLYNLHSHHQRHPPPPPVKPPRKLSERGLPLEHSRSHHQLHQSGLREPLQAWQQQQPQPLVSQPVRRSSSNCSDRAVIWNEHRSAAQQPQSLSLVNPNAASSFNLAAGSRKTMNGRHGSLPSQPTLRRFMVNCGDVYAQVDKSQKRSIKSSKDQSGKQSRSKSEHGCSADYGEFGQTMDEPIYSTIERQASAHSIACGPNLIDSAKLMKSKSVEKRKKRSNISIPLQVRSFDLDIDGMSTDSLQQQHSMAPPPPPPLPAAPCHSEALQQIQQICNKLHQDYKRERRKLCKQTSTEETEFVDRDWTGRQVQVRLRNIENQNGWNCCNASVGTETIEDDEQTMLDDRVSRQRKRFLSGHLEQSSEDPNKSFQSSTSNPFVELLRKEKTHRRKSSDDVNFNG